MTRVSTSIGTDAPLTERILRVAREKQLTLRETALYFSVQRSPFVGTAKTVADEIERWFCEEAADGFNIRVTANSEFARFVDAVLPILRERDLFREEYEHDTLRGHLGLPVPVNRHSAARLSRDRKPQLAESVLS